MALAGLWIAGLALWLLLLLWLHFMHVPAAPAWPPFAEPGARRSCLMAALFPSLLACWAWNTRRRPGGQPRPLWVQSFQPPFLAAISLLSPLTGRSEAHPDWASLLLCLPPLYAASALWFWCRSLLPEAAPAESARLLVPNLKPASRPRRVPFLAASSEREIVFRQSRTSRAGGFLFALVPLRGAAFGLAVALAGGHGAASAVVLVPGCGLFALLLLSTTGPNEVRFDLTNRTYRLRRYKPWPFALSAVHGLGVPFWEQETVGPLDDILRLDLREVRYKGRSYWLYVVWRDGKAAPAFLTVLHCEAEARDALRRLADTLDVAAFP